MDNLLEIIQEYLEGFVVTKGDFTSPRSEFIVEFFYRVLTEFEADLDHVKKYYTMGDCVLDDMCGLNVEILNLCNIMNYILPSLNLGLFDILTPTPKRTFELVSKAMDFIALADSIMSELNDKMTSFAYEKQEIMKQKNEAEELRAEANTLATEKDRLEQRRLTMERSLLLLKQECEDLHEDERNCQYRKEKIANVQEKLVSELEDHRIKLETLKAAIELRSADVLGNPEVYFERIKELEQQRASAVAATIELENKLKEKSERKKLLSSDCEAIDEPQKHLDTLAEILNKCNEKNQELSLIDPAGLAAQISVLNDDIQSIANENKAVERNISTVMTKKQELLSLKSYNDLRTELRQVEVQINAVNKRIEYQKLSYWEKIKIYAWIKSTIANKCEEAESSLKD